MRMKEGMARGWQGDGKGMVNLNQCEQLHSVAVEGGFVFEGSRFGFYITDKFAFQFLCVCSFCFLGATPPFNTSPFFVYREILVSYPVSACLLVLLLDNPWRVVERFYTSGWLLLQGAGGANMHHPPLLFRTKCDSYSRPRRFHKCHWRIKEPGDDNLHPRLVLYPPHDNEP